MRTLQQELVKFRHFVTELRHSNNTMGEKNMQTENTTQISRSTGGQASNKRYKRTSEELDQDIAKVDELVASGKYNQIEALNKMNLQSSVYHYRKRIQQEDPAKSNKKRKFSPRPNRVTNKEQYAARKAKVMQELQEAPAKKTLATSDLETRLEEIKAKYEKLKEYAQVQARYNELKKEVESSGLLG